MTTRDPDVRIRAFFSEGAELLPDRVFDAVRADIERPGAWPRARLGVPRPGVLVAGLAAVAVIVVAGASLVLGPSQPAVGGPSSGPSATAASSTPSAVPADIPGLPPRGSLPTDPRRGSLALSLAGNLDWIPRNIWLFEDGRLIWDYLDPPVPSGPSIGLYQQRLTPSGVEYLRAAALATGLFENDMALRKEGPYLGITVDDGERLVQLTWAWHGVVGADAPGATVEQAAAITGLYALLTDPDAWPADAWANRKAVPFFPATYQICFRRNPVGNGYAGPIDPAYVLTWLPEAAQEILGAAVLDATPGRPIACYEVSTAAALSIATAVQDAGIRRDRIPGEGPGWLPGVDPGLSNTWVKFTVQDPAGQERSVWMWFASVLPDGEAAYLGPG
jgi:hypothetical protein